jgi:N-acetylmuramoyl-L-alanine amidase
METEGSRKAGSLPCWAAAWALLAILVAVPASASAWPGVALSGGAPKPPINSDRISYGDERKAQMARYSDRHYGEREWRLRNPKVIVLHFTATDSYASVWSAFDSNAPNLGERPGVCSHYLIEQNGTIGELVPPRVRCRHTIGLNHVSIGIEMVQATGQGAHWADQQILDRRRQVGAALRLVRWLQARYGIPTREVIGHSMANDDRYFLDLQGWTNDHTDWLKRDVREFRRRLRG